MPIEAGCIGGQSEAQTVWWKYQGKAIPRGLVSKTHGSYAAFSCELKTSIKLGILLVARVATDLGDEKGQGHFHNLLLVSIIFI